jgi:hypothetical protein
MKIGTNNTYNLETIDVLATVYLISIYRLGRKIKFLQAHDTDLVMKTNIWYRFVIIYDKFWTIIAS